MNSPRMAVYFVCDKGHKVTALDQNGALIHWHMIMEDHDDWIPKNTKSLTLCRGAPTVFHEGEQFIDQIISCIERHFGKEPKVNRETSHWSQCRMLLKFLKKHGNIRELHFADDWKKLPKGV